MEAAEPDCNYTLKTADGLELCGRDWRPGEEVRAVICLLHGLGEHCRRYDHVADHLNSHGYAFLSLDLRGHGNSGGQRGHIHSYRALMDDISLLLEEAGERYGGIPTFLYGHSMGGNLVINYALRRRPRIYGVVASAPLLRTAYESPMWNKILAKMMYHLWPGWSTSSGLNVDDLSRDPEVVRRYREDPLVHDRVTARFLDVTRAGLWALEHSAGFPLPLLLMHGSADRITSPQASTEFKEKSGDNCTLEIWPGLYHEIHNEPERNEVLGYLIKWLDKIISVVSRTNPVV